MANNKSQTGAISIIIALIILSIVTASVVVLGGTLSRQLRASRDFVNTERAFYAANSGFEHGLYLLIKKGEAHDADNPIVDQINYGSENAEYQAQANLTETGEICALGVGTFRNLVRKLAVGTADCTF